jgi:D-3-phosphoglycerate dehydrogenase
MTGHVLLTDRAWPDWSVETAILEGAGHRVVAPDACDEATLIPAARDAAAIGVCWARLSPAVLSAAPRLRIIARFGIGLDNIPLDEAAARGILVTNVPDYCTEEVADHTLALLLACLRKTALFDRELRSGRYVREVGPPLRRLRGLTLGLVGLGRIGRAVAQRAAAFGMTVVAAASFSASAAAVNVANIRRLPYDELLACSDVVSLHCPLTDATRGLFSGAAFDKMKPGAILINTSRGALVDPAALHHVLVTGRLAAAGLDVFEPEPPDLAHPLFQHPHLVATPHTAFASEEALLELRTRTARQIATALAGGTPECVVVGLRP